MPESARRTAISSHHDGAFSRRDRVGWLIRSLEQQVKDNPFLEELFDARFQLELELERQYRQYLLGKQIKYPNTYQEVALLSFVVMASCVYQRLSATGRDREEDSSDYESDDGGDSRHDTAPSPSKHWGLWPGKMTSANTSPTTAR